MQPLPHPLVQGPAFLIRLPSSKHALPFSTLEPLPKLCSDLNCPPSFSTPNPSTWPQTTLSLRICPQSSSQNPSRLQYSGDALLTLITTLPSACLYLFTCLSFSLIECKDCVHSSLKSQQHPHTAPLVDSQAAVKISTAINSLHLWEASFTECSDTDDLY